MNLRRLLWIIFAIVWVGIAVTVFIGVMGGHVEPYTSTPEP